MLELEQQPQVLHIIPGKLYHTTAHSCSYPFYYLDTTGPGIHAESMPNASSRKCKAGSARTEQTVKRQHTNNASEPSLASRRKAAEARITNLIQTLDAAATPPETLTIADVSQNRPVRPLRSAAHNIWYFTASYHSPYPPESGSGRAELVAADAIYQSSRPFDTFIRPGGVYVHCIPCV